MKDDKPVVSMPVGKRTRNQQALRFKEMREKNKRARLAARNRHREMHSEKNIAPNDDNSNEEEIKVVDEAEYLRRVSKPGGGDSCPNVGVELEEDSDSDSSVQIIGETWNPLGADFNHVDSDGNGDDVSDSYRTSPSQAVEKGPSDLRMGCQSSSIEVSSENDTCSEDDNSTDEDFRMDDATNCTSSSEYSSSEASWKDTECKGRNKIENGADRARGSVPKNKRVGILAKPKNDPMPRKYADREEGKVTKNKSVEIESKRKNDPIHDESYLCWINCFYGADSAETPQGEYHEKIFVEKSYMPKQRNEGIESERENDIMSSESSDSSVKGSFVNSSNAYYPENDNWPGEIGSFVNGSGNIKRHIPGKGKNVVLECKTKKGRMTKECCKKGLVFPASPSAHYPGYEIGGSYEKGGLSQKKYGSFDISGKKKVEYQPNKSRVEIKSTPLMKKFKSRSN